MGDKVWAKYDGPSNFPDIGPFLWVGWLRHVGPTPPDEDWHPHDGSAKRPKGVGKRDRIQAYFNTENKHFSSEAVAEIINWDCVTRYRIIDRAPKKEKRRKVWLLQGPWNEGFEVILDPFDGSAEYVMSKREKGYILYAAKLTLVKDTDK